MTAQLEEMITPVVNAMGYEIWGVERLSQGNHATLKVFIDAEAGINVDDCADVSRQISALFDVEDPISGKYTLEVSSPGMDRRLFKLHQCQEFAGAMVKVSLRRALDGRRRYKGRLVGTEGEEVVVRTEETEEILVPFEDIERINVVPEY